MKKGRSLCNQILNIIDYILNIIKYRIDNVKQK
jgi:hypothetical protein